MLTSILISGMAHASTFSEIPTLAVLTSRSNAVVQGEVIGTRTERCAVGLCTAHTILVQDVWKGTVEDIVQVTLPGGRMDGLEQRVSGVPRWTEGDRVVVFIDEQGAIPLTGILTVTDDDRPVDPLHRSFIPSTMAELNTFVRDRYPGRDD